MSDFTARAITNWCPECGKPYTHECGEEGYWFTVDSLAEVLHTVRGPHNNPYPTRQVCPGPEYDQDLAHELDAAKEAERE